MTSTTVVGSSLRVIVNLVSTPGHPLDLTQTRAATLFVTSGRRGRHEHPFTLVGDGTDGRVQFTLEATDTVVVHRVIWQFRITMGNGKVIWSTTDGTTLVAPG